MNFHRRLIWFGMLWFGLSGFAESPAQHYMYLFAIDDGEQTPSRNHTLATFFEARRNPGGAFELRQHTINWLPVSHVIEALALGPERGRNFPPADAFSWAVRDRLTISQWGPFEINQQLYDLSIRQKALLDSGEIWYRVLDIPERIFKILDPPSVPTPRAVMCISAVSDIVYPVDRRGFLLTGFTSGIPATAKVALHLADWYVRYPGNPYYLSVVDQTLIAQMDRAVGISGYRNVAHWGLQAQANTYCRTMAECRAAAFNLTPK